MTILNTNSFYDTHAFTINYRWDYLDENGWPSESAIPAFFHEYSHLIQDVATLYGVKKIIDLFDVVSVLAQYCNQSRVIKVPFEKTLYYQRNYISLLDKISDAEIAKTKWDGSTFWAFRSFSDYEFEDIPCESSNKVFAVPYVKACFINNLTGETIDHKIGILEIKEAYATAVEFFYKDVFEVENGDDERGDFCYFAIERIIAYFFTNYTSELIAVICHWSLQSMHPALEFKFIIDFLKEQDVQSAKDVHEMLKKRFWKEHYMDLLYISNKVREFVSIQNPLGQVYYHFDWFRYKIQKRLPFLLLGNFPMSLFNIKKDEEKDLFAEMKKWSDIIPIFLYTRNGEDSYSCGGFNSDTQHAFYFCALKNVIHHIRKGSDKECACPFVNSCPMKEKKCDSEPWRLKKACPYVQAVRTLNIGKKACFKKAVKVRTS